MDIELCHVKETEYLHAKLAECGKKFPSFRPSGFRSLEPPTEEEEMLCTDIAFPLAEVLKQDEELWVLLERCKSLRRAIIELGAAREMINNFAYLRLAQQRLE